MSFRPVFALACALQVFLLSLASVSPELHEGLFHSMETPVAGGPCQSCDHGPAADDGKGTTGDSSGDIDEEQCPVTLFAQGVPAGEMPPSAAASVFFGVEETSRPVEQVRSGLRLATAQARAPPQS